MKLRIINTNNAKLLSTLDCRPATKTGGESRKKMTMEEDEDDGEKEKDSKEEDDSIESIAFSSQLPLVACSTLSGHVLVWDLNTESVRCHFDNQAEGYSKLVWSNEKIYAATLAGRVQIFDGRNLERLHTLRCHRDAEILDFQLDPSRLLVCTAASDGLVKIFKTN